MSVLGISVPEILEDIRYAIRILLKSFGFTAVALLTVSHCHWREYGHFQFCGRCSSQPLPYTHTDRIMRVLEEQPATLTAEMEFPR